MARKFGKINQMSTKFEDYSYIINGVGGIGKTSLVYEIGKLITGSDEGTFIITCGGENEPKHIDGAFGDVAKDFKTFVAIVKELCDNKAEYPHTRFVAIDSLDEYARIAENFVVAEWNANCDINDRVKSISQAYKGFQKGESRACDLMIQQVMKLQNAGYSILEIGHTKTKLREDVITKVQFEQLTCNLDNKYYNALKDKVNLVAMCYWENTVDNIEEKKNAFTKKMEKVGELSDRKRVMAFADDDNVIDTKTHFDCITQKIDLNASAFIKAVEDAIALKLQAANGEKPKTTNKKKAKTVEVPVEETEGFEDIVADVDVVDDIENITEDTVPFDLNEPTIDLDALCIDIRTAFKVAEADVKKKVKTILTEKGDGKLDVALGEKVLGEIANILGI